MKNRSLTTIEGQFLHTIYSPHGSVEGVLVEAQDRPIQFVFAHEDDASPAAFHGLGAKQAVVVEGVLQEPSPKGDAEHPVYEFSKLVSIDGHPPRDRGSATDGPAYKGTVVRFNYARHGERNGVILDTGDFIHSKPDGMAILKLRVGDSVEADGDAHRLVDDSGWAVDATVVNGKAL